MSQEKSLEQIEVEARLKRMEELLFKPEKLREVMEAIGEPMEVKEDWSPRPSGKQDSWKEIDLTIGDGGIKSIDPNRLVKLEGELEPGSKFKIIRNEELWATDPETGECRDFLHRHTYVRDVAPEEQQYLEHQLYTEGVLQSVLSQHFN